LLGVFAGSSGLLYPGPQSTVVSEVSLATCPRNIPTDIPQDFAIRSGTELYAQVPTGATSLWFSPNDCYFRDNTDPNGDYGANIKVTIHKTCVLT